MPRSLCRLRGPSGPFPSPLRLCPRHDEASGFEESLLMWRVPCVCGKRGGGGQELSPLFLHFMHHTGITSLNSMYHVPIPKKRMCACAPPGGPAQNSEAEGGGGARRVINEA